MITFFHEVQKKYGSLFPLILFLVLLDLQDNILGDIFHPGKSFSQQKLQKVCRSRMCSQPAFNHSEKNKGVKFYLNERETEAQKLISCSDKKHLISFSLALLEVCLLVSSHLHSENTKIRWQNLGNEQFPRETKHEREERSVVCGRKQRWM